MPLAETMPPSESTGRVRPKIAVIVQSNYLPWRGYFDLLSRADEIILYDSVQYTRRDWRNRNQIKTANGLAWITIPVESKGNYLQSIDGMRVTAGWAPKHEKSIALAYQGAAAFEATAAWLFSTLADVSKESLLTNINERLLRTIMACLGIATPLRRCTEVLRHKDMIKLGPTERLVSLCQAVGAQHYLSGPTAKAYLDVTAFDRAGISVVWMSYEGYPQYRQLWGDFVPNVSIVDLLLNMGDDAPGYLKSH
jgi:hypothetical protein